MKKPLFCVILLCIVIFSAENTFAGSKCYGMTTFSDSVKTSVSTPDPANPGNKVLTGALYVPGAYYLPFIGTLLKDANGIDKRFSVHMINNTTSYGGFRDCILDATLGTTAPIQGPFEINCGAGGFTVTGTLIQVNCGSLPSPSFELLSTDLPLAGK